jgi:hypothetical protein
MIMMMKDKFDPTGLHGINYGPHLSSALEASLLDLLVDIDVDATAVPLVKAFGLEAHSEDLADGGGGLGVTSPPALERVLERVLHRRRRRHYPAVVPVHHVRRYVLQRHEQPQHVPLHLRHGYPSLSLSARVIVWVEIVRKRVTTNRSLAQCEIGLGLKEF